MLMSVRLKQKNSFTQEAEEEEVQSHHFNNLCQRKKEYTEIFELLTNDERLCRNVEEFTLRRGMQNSLRILIIVFPLHN